LLFLFVSILFDSLSASLSAYFAGSEILGGHYLLLFVSIIPGKNNNG